MESIAERHERECNLPNNDFKRHKFASNFAYFEKTEHLEITQPKGGFIAHKFLYEDSSIICMTKEGDFWSWFN